ncbi:MAG TPA: PhnD/SsuA/transferrin family substrate-binding protein [Parasulfuritortus sp.]
MKRRLLPLFFVLLSTLSTTALAAGPLILAVSEGTSGGIDTKTALAKYHGLASLLSKALGTGISIRFVREFAQLEAGMKAHEFDLVMARPSDYPARGLRDYGYRFVATAEPAGHCDLIVAGNSPLKSIHDLHGKTFVFPEKQAYMTRFCNAELRDNGIDLNKESVFYVREQGAIPFALLNGIADVGGVASYSGAVRKWTGSGQRVLHESGPQPYFPVIAGPALSASQVAKVQATLDGLGDSDAGKAVLKQLAITGFVSTEETRLRQLLKWLGV